ncbi:uncharacterized protein LOC128957596 [Oppia nitens]|uniref:uncharacterized protein LOC128957596 n=1 Tax=Oppia nitens TaxID=1686743 RepID=UPI0023D99CDF|nr:uncharacterized protein LOC128957596 [Oppia nitens]
MAQKQDNDLAQQEVEDNTSVAPKVQSLRQFFDNRLIGFKPITSADNELTNTIEAKAIDSSDKSEDIDVIPQRPKRTNAKQPNRQSNNNCNIKVPPLLRTLIGVDQNATPVPMPRKSLLKNRSIDQTYDESSSSSCDYKVMPIECSDRFRDKNQRSNSLIASLTKELNELNFKANNNLRSNSLHSLNCLPKFDENLTSISSNIESNVTNVTQDMTIIPIIESKTPKSMTKSKTTFKSILKKSKLLSLRKRSAQKSDKNCQMNSHSSNVCQIRPIKPTRDPPPPPILIFRPPAPLPPEEPKEDYYEDTLEINGYNHLLPNTYELYNDSEEQIYSTLDNEDESDDQLYEGIDNYDDLTTGDKDLYSCDDNYYEESAYDLDGIYEVLPFEKDFETDNDSLLSTNSTISLDSHYSENQNLNGSKDNLKVDSKLSSFEKKQNLKAIKLRKKFNLTGDEIPVNAGIVKEDNRGNRYDLFVRKGETVLILRMEANPPGKWLAKSERSKVGFVDLDNISFDAESVKSVIKILTDSQCNNQTNQ